MRPNLALGTEVLFFAEIDKLWNDTFHGGCTKLVQKPPFQSFLLDVTGTPLTFDSYLKGKTGNGDLCNFENILSVEESLRGKHIHFVVADGGFELTGDHLYYKELLSG